MGVVRNKIPWDLRQRGKLDSNRHAKKIKQAVKDNLQHIIAEEEIISTDGKRTTKIPVKYLDSYRFVHGTPTDGVGHGEGEEGDILKDGREKQGKGDKAGNSPGRDIYDVEISVDELTEMMMEDLGLPYFKDKDHKEIITTKEKFIDIRKRGIRSNWSKKRTIMENIKRNARSGKAVFKDLHEDDMRFITWDQIVERHSNAIVYLMMDRSGSMDEGKRYLCKATFWWLCRFLEKKYDRVEVVFIAHDTEAKIVPEKDFFTISNDGGTRCSSAYEICLEDIKENRPANIWNIYCFHFSDGDNWDDDNEKCIKLVKEMLVHANMFAYGQVEYNNMHTLPYGLMNAMNSGIKDDRFMTTVLKEKADVYAALKAFLGKEIDK
jgi:sporulation protein YhbH